MGRDVGQNLQSKSSSKNRRDWVIERQKEGPFLELSFDVCLYECCYFRLLSGHYSVRGTFPLPRKGSAHALFIPCFRCLFLVNLFPLNIHQLRHRGSYLKLSPLSSLSFRLWMQYCYVTPSLWAWDSQRHTQVFPYFHVYFHLSITAVLWFLSLLSKTNRWFPHVRVEYS